MNLTDIRISGLKRGVDGRNKSGHDGRGAEMFTITYIDACLVKQEIYRAAERRPFKGDTLPYNVMAGLVPAIHAFFRRIFR